MYIVSPLPPVTGVPSCVAGGVCSVVIWHMVMCAGFGMTPWCDDLGQQYTSYIVVVTFAGTLGLNP